MLEQLDTPAAVEEISLNDRIDELSVRLIIDGLDTLAKHDFERLSDYAVEAGNKRFAEVATRLAGCFDRPDAGSIPVLTGLLSSGLEELRTILDLDQQTAGSERPETAVVEAISVPERRPAEPTVNVIASDPEMILEFIMEAGEHLTVIETQMLLLEKDNTASEIVNAVFRAFHTIKGLAGFLELTPIQSLAHEVETVLDLARSSQLDVTPLVVDVVLESTDIIRQEVSSLELKVNGKDAPPTAVDETLLQKVRNLAKGDQADTTSNAPVPAPVVAPVAAKTVAPVPAPAVAKAASLEMVPATAPALKLEVAAEPVIEKAAPAAQREPVKPADLASVRIDTAKLDQLMDMVGEMVIAQTLIGHSPALSSVKDARLLRDLTQLARITADVQRITTGMRMVPIGVQFQKTARLVRDLSRRAGKLIVLETTGEDTELDKTIAEQLSDPLLHMVRNSIDHGIEPPEERVAQGKDATARIRISAYHQSGQIVISIGDDGRGLNRERILAKALQNGLIQPGQQLTDNEIYLLIFEAGFSTAEKITDISGRGVGMDVVRKHVQKLRGRIEIQSNPGVGTTFFIKLPLTLAIIEGLVVVVGSHRYIVPIFSVAEMFRPTPEMLSTVHGTGEMAMVRGGLMPIIRLHRCFDVEPKSTEFGDGVLIVAESEGKRFCLFVDDLVGKQEVVIKSLGESFKQVEGVAGCAILGDGRVGLILDIDGIYRGRH